MHLPEISLQEIGKPNVHDRNKWVQQPKLFLQKNIDFSSLLMSLEKKMVKQ